MSVLAGVAAPAHAALDARALFEQMDRERHAIDMKQFWDQQDRMLT